MIYARNSLLPLDIRLNCPSLKSWVFALDLPVLLRLAIFSPKALVTFSLIGTLSAGTVAF